MHGKAISLVALACIVAFGAYETAASGGMSEMTQEEQIRTRENYEARIAARRLAELKVIWGQAAANGVDATTLLYLDFRFFASEETSARALSKELLEYYEVQIEYDESLETWFVDGTTRPLTMALGEEVLVDWVEYMVEQGFQQNAILTSFGLARQGNTGVEWSTETVEVEED